MVDGNIRGTLIEIGDRITTGLHQGRYECIGLGDCPLRVIDEARLQYLPLASEEFPLRRIEIVDLELFNPLLTSRQLRFRSAFRALLSHRPLVPPAQNAGASPLSCFYVVFARIARQKPRRSE